MGIKPQTLEKIKSAPLSKVVEACGGTLKKVGYEFVTECPWHDDTNPSLTISDRKGFCFCHVCREGGDATDYIQQKKGLAWREATEMAAGILGISVETDDANPEEVARRAAERKKALAALDKENQGYIANLHDKRAERIRQILKDRGFKKEAAVEFGLGFAPKGFFAGRITVPIYNHLNQLVGWTGRATGDQPGKYKNTADNDLFHKKHHHTSPEEGLAIFAGFMDKLVEEAKSGQTLYVHNPGLNQKIFELYGVTGVLLLLWCISAN